MRLRVGTRGSRLARVQTMWVADRIKRVEPSVSIELIEIETTGDRIRDVPLGPHVGRSFFTKEIEQALLDCRIDVAVHSCKDLATTTTPGLRLGAIPEREDPRDALVSRSGTLDKLPPGARVGTSSPRRRGFLSRARPDLALLQQRGNVPTRVRAVSERRLDAIVLALAGLRRLDLSHVVTETLDPSVMLPAAAQGALAVQVREDDPGALRLVEPLEHAESRAQISAERACLRALEAGCQAPVGALARIHGRELALSAAIVSTDAMVWVEEAGPVEESAEIGAAAASSLLERLGLSSLRQVPWAGTAPAWLARTEGSGR